MISKSPLEGLGHSLVEVVDESQDTLSQLINRCEIAMLECPADHYTESYLDLVE